MEHTPLYSEIQENIQIQGKVSTFFDAFAIGKLLPHLGVKLHSFFNRLTNEERESVLIIDDSTGRR